MLKARPVSRLTASIVASTRESMPISVARGSASGLTARSSVRAPRPSIRPRVPPMRLSSTLSVTN